MKKTKITITHDYSYITHILSDNALSDFIKRVRLGTENIDNWVLLSDGLRRRFAIGVLSGSIRIKFSFFNNELDNFVDRIILKSIENNWGDILSNCRLSKNYISKYFKKLALARNNNFYDKLLQNYLEKLKYGSAKEIFNFAKNRTLFINSSKLNNDELEFSPYF